MMYFMVTSSEEKGTLTPYRGFDPQADCEALQTALEKEKSGVKEESIMNILCFRSTGQRQIIKIAFQQIHRKDLVSELNSELKGNLEDVIVGLMYRPAEFDAVELHNAMKGLGTKESTLIEILASRTNEEIQAIGRAYWRMFEQHLEKDILDDTSLHLRQLLGLMARGNRDESFQVAEAKAKLDARRLYNAGEKEWGTDESVFNEILGLQNYAQLHEVFKAYEEITGRDIETAIHKEFSGDMEDALMAIVQCVKNKQRFFAEKLYKSMKGFGTDDRTLKRIIISRCEIDMVQIKEQFQLMYEKSLASFIKDDISGNYKSAMLNLVHG